MNGVEEIYYKKKCIAIVFRNDITLADGVQFLTPPENPFQIGFHRVHAGKVMAGHFHRLDKPLSIDTVQELLLVQSGKVKVTLLSKDGSSIATIILLPNDGILLMHEGHGVEVLEDAQIFEVKQGPYPGFSNAKIYVTPHKTS